MLKANASYRDGSKLSQLLNRWRRGRAAGRAHADEPKPPSRCGTAERIVHRYIARRRRLPDRRAGYTRSARIGNHAIYPRTGEYEDGTLGEIFVDMHKEGAAFRSMTNCFYRYLPACSTACRWKSSWTRSPSPASSRTAGDGQPAHQETTPIIDYIFRELAITYLDRGDPAHVTPDDPRRRDEPAKDEQSTMKRSFRRKSSTLPALHAEDRPPQTAERQRPQNGNGNGHAEPPASAGC